MTPGRGDRGIDRSQPPKARAPDPFELPPVDRARLSSGLDLRVIRSTAFPLIHLDLVTRAGAHHEDVATSGLATLTAALLDEGTTTRTSQSIAREIEQLGASLSTEAGWNAAYMTFSGMAKHLTSGLELLADLARNPTFPEEELERLRRRRAGDLARRTTQPAALGTDRLLRTLYGTTAYGAPLIGSVESISSITRQDAVRFYDAFVSPHGSTLVAVGDTSAEEMSRTAERAFGDWLGPPQAPLPTIEPEELVGRTLWVVDRPEAAQTELRIGHAGVPRTHPDWPALVVMNTILGGKFTSRLNLSLRERHGFTYGAHSGFARRSGPGPFVISTAVATEVTGAATTEIFRELERIQTDEVESDDLADTVSYLIGVFPYLVQTIDGLADRLVEVAVHELPDDYHARHLEALRAVTRENVLDVARRHLHPDQAVVVAVGPARDLQPQLATFGEVRVTSPPSPTGGDLANQ